MALIRTEKHSPRDLESWERVERVAAIHARLKRHQGRVVVAERELLSFAQLGRCYVGVSWGKDSVAVADMAQRLCPHVPLVWIRVEPIVNPECEAVRDAFLATFPAAEYHEIVRHCRIDETGIHASGTLESGFAEAAQRFGDRYVSGIRADESGMRKMRYLKHGHSTARTCAPLSRWSGDDIFAYLCSRGLPIHPAYGYLMDGILDPRRVRVASLGGERGTGWGRREWERRYYGEELAAIERLTSE